ncbi:transcription factor LRL2-like [Vicia villosa]|uniref:transcription factor LRL2-like n=1 Tax=Vicia villosa TaxID=3911 RepID=UPI00273A9E7B|nr:transcription factor LRL2-like [Vicia villosa]
MEGESNNKDNSSEPVSYENEEETSNHEVPEDHHIQNQQSETSVAQWNCVPKLPYSNYVEYLSESSTYLPTAEYNLVGNNYQTLGSTNSFNDQGKAFGFGFKPIGSSSNDYGIMKHAGFWRNNGEEEEEAITAKTGSTQNLLNAECDATWPSDSVGDKHNASRFDSMGMVGDASPFLLPIPKSGSSSTRQKSEKSRCTDRHRRQRIADNLKALHELLPNQEGGCQAQAYILDDIIDYVKYLQNQLKELSGSKLQSDSNAIPLVYHEGYGHYIKDQMLNEPLEEIMGKLVEEQSAATSQLLESKGLILLPIALLEELNQAMQLLNQAS